MNAAVPNVKGPDTSDAAVSNTSERLLTMVTTFVKDFHANRCAFTFFFTHINELTQMHGKDLAGIKVKLKELLMDVRSSMGKSSGEQILGFHGALFGGGAAFRGHLPPRVLSENPLLAYSELFVPGVHGPTSNGGPGKRASSIVRLGLTQVMKVKIQYLLHTAMEQFECALAVGQLDVAGRVCRTLRFLGDNIDLPMVRGRFSEASQILDQRGQSIREEVHLLVRDGAQKSDFDAVKARRALDLIDNLDKLSTLDPERNRSSAAITVRTFFQAELQTIVDKLRALDGEASREPPVERAPDWLTMSSSWAAASVPARLRPR